MFEMFLIHILVNIRVSTLKVFKKEPPVILIKKTYSIYSIGKRNFKNLATAVNFDDDRNTKT